jgi:hypothetical protein
MGTLELLWQTAHDAGDPTFPNAESVEAAAWWQGESGALVAALTAPASRFLDEAGTGFELHDYFDHAPRYVRDRAARAAARHEAGVTLSDLRRKAVNSRRDRQQAATTSAPVATTALQQDTNEPRLYTNGMTPNTQHPTPTPNSLTLFGEQGRSEYIPSSRRGRETEIAWRVEQVWKAHLEAKRRFFREVNGVSSGHVPKLTPKVRAAIAKAILTYDEELLGPDDRERFARESAARAAGIGIFHDPWMTGETPDNDARNGGKRYLEDERPWVPMRGKTDPVLRFSALYFEQRAVAEAAAKRAVPIDKGAS